MDQNINENINNLIKISIHGLNNIFKYQRYLAGNYTTIFSLIFLKIKLKLPFTLKYPILFLIPV